ncbi:MAG: ABC transporter ATP-binding protein/permease [Lachnospiraceae bacterium]|nr:ABC transporter ATP-binding protein/permease [Lachnospiraceae bacterium]
MKTVLSWLKNYKKEAFFAPFFKLTEACFELIVPLVMADIIDTGIVNGDNAYILKKGGVLVLLAAAGLAVAITAQYFAAKAAVGVSGMLRKNLFAHIMGMEARDVDRNGTSTLITRMTSDINQVQTGINMSLRLLLRSPIIVFGAMIMAFTIDVPSALVFCVAVPILAFVVIGITRVSIPMFLKVQGLLDKVMLSSRENLTGVRVIRAFNLQDDEKKAFVTRNDALKKEQIKASNFTALTNPLTFIIVNAATMFLIYKGALRVNIGVITQGQAVAILNYMSQILVELLKLTNLIVTITKSLASAQRVSSILYEGKAEDDKPVDGKTDDGRLAEVSDGQAADGDGEKVNEGTVPTFTDDIVVFDHVSLRYSKGSEDALSDISFSVKKGMTVGIIGGTGSGKSSLVNLIPRMYEASEGKVSVFGKDVSDSDVSDLRDRIGVVPQKAVLFKGSIRSNMQIGNGSATDEEMTECLKKAQAYDFVADKGGLDAEVLQNGKNFSGGQRQRLTIARALVRKPKILILDDSTSALDFLTEKSIREEIARIEDATVFIVSQRASSVMNADMIIVLDDGKAVGIGTHEELLENCEVYEEIYYSQFEKKAQ